MVISVVYHVWTRDVKVSRTRADLHGFWVLVEAPIAGNLGPMDTSQHYLMATKTESVRGIMYLAVTTLGTVEEIPEAAREALEDIARRAAGALGPKDFVQTTSILEKLRAGK